MQMMNERWLIIGTDERMRFLAKQLSTNDRTVYYKNTAVWDEALNKVALELHPTEVVLPIHPLTIQVDELLGIRQAQFFAGKLNDEWKQLLQEKRIHYYLTDETFIWKNAALTAESFLAHLYQGKVNVQYKTFIITGFGRVAKMLALFLTRLNAKVIIAVRSDHQKAEALAYGYKGIELKEGNSVDADFLINTIPTDWLTKNYASWTTRPIYDLASSPGCLNDVKLSQYELLPGLPGKYFPQAAARLLTETILELRKEDKSA
ncbi:dipicolinate synthase subunit A [Solibacillus sp. FSL K6-4121]|uniref:dipicolinate synthase subunit A n=1 Tax=Solibacillus sp. FSL K6-4121 TaxID=2921505 RepID=UPI0030FBE9B5